MSNTTTTDKSRSVVASENTTVDPHCTAQWSDSTAPVGSAGEHSGVFHLIRKYASISDLLRVGGVVSVAVAMGMFLMDGLEGFTDLQRFLTMLGFTGVLTGAGFLMSMLVKEQRGSRAFMGLSLLSVPVNFTVFGALLYSFIPLDGMAQNYPGFALWQADSTDIITALAAGVVVLIPVVWMSYTVLARTAKSWLTTSLLLSSTVLVLPVRQEIIIAVLAVLTASILWWVVRKNSKDSLALKTIEGKFAVAMLFVAPAVLIARGLFLYNASGVLVFMLSTGVYLVLRQLLVSQEKQGLLTSAGTIVAAFVALLVSVAGADVIDNLITGELEVIIGIGGFLMLTHDIVKVSPSQGVARTVGVISVIMSVCGLVAIPLITGTALVTAIAMATLVAVAVYGYLRAHLLITGIALSGMVIISLLYIQTIWNMALQTGWWGIAAAGVVAIVAGSLVDRAGTVVVEKA